MKQALQPNIFVSHSSTDKTFCDALVRALRAAGADVWYDEHDLSTGPLRRVIMRELRSRPVFIVVLSKAALTSDWVLDECEWAYDLFKREQGRTILPVTAQPLEPSDFDSLLFLNGFRRIETTGMRPHPVDEAAARTVQALNLIPGEAACAKDEGPVRTQRVLVVDDDMEIREALRAVFEDAGYEVSEAPDGVVALDLLRHGPAGMVVLLDFMMPRLSGIELLHLVASDPQLKRRHAYIGVHAHSALPEGVSKLLTSLAVPILTKPFDLDMALDAVAKAAARLR